MPKTTKYDANFTAGGILFNEFKAIEHILLNPDFSKLMKVESEENNFIGIATKSARKRVIQEINRRYQQVGPEFWQNYISWSDYDQRLGLFYLCLKAYPIVLDIHLEVALKKYQTGLPLEAYDIQMRLEEIMSNDDYVASWSESTIKKINLQYRKALKEVDLISDTKLQAPSKASVILWDYFKEINELWFLKACFINS
ncbi:BrxA family protein [Gilvibacter sp.]|uniref:BrxA family protein n=1 Tax=Gilvibacter sp. TaxID=2729997 RepID=UPI003B51CB81